MSDEQVFHVRPDMAASAQVDTKQYRLMLNHADRDTDSFWLEQARRLDWMREPTMGCNAHFSGDYPIRWFEDGELNVSANCLDRHLDKRADDVALLWVGDEEGVERRITFGALHEEVSRFANVLKARGVERGDRVALFLPMVPEAAVAMLACTRIGAVHSVMFAGFSASSVASRIADSGAKLVVTADEGRRGGKRIKLKAIIDDALAEPGQESVQHVVVVAVTGGDVARVPGRDLDYATEIAAVSPVCAPEPMGAEDPLFILYTSGSTGKPKGVLHTTGGYLLWASLTHSLVFDYRPGEVYWCTADVGWVTGHSYGVYGPLANGATTLMFEGIPTFPDAGRWWRIIEHYKVAYFYTAPTAIRALMREGDAPVKATDRSSLRVLATVGETINPEAWLWFHHVVGDGRVPLVDTWWQTETGGHLIAGPAALVAQKPGSATLPLPGVFPVLLDDKGQLVEGEGEGALCIARSWPGQMRTLWGDHKRFIEAYFSTFPGYYFSGDGARRDADGYYWVTGRMDDVINVSGHRIGSAEVEAALTYHHAVAEAAVVGVPHDIKGSTLFAFIILTDAERAARDETAQRALCSEVATHVGKVLGRYAVPETVVVVPDLPKTRSGKIMRRVLRKIATNELDSLGDTSTLADPGVVDAIVDRLRRLDLVPAH